MEHIASISYGKDSIAMLEVIKRHGLPLDRIVHVEIMATKDIPADLPEVVEWKEYADGIIEKRYGISVEHIRADETYEELFYGIPKRSEKNKELTGQIRGFPSLQSQWCSRALKVRVMKRLNKPGTVQYIGIAVNEESRFSQLTAQLRAPLVEYNVTEDECFRICDELNLLAPNYLHSKRSGCWFCHAQPIKELRILRKEHKDLWNKLLTWDKDSPIPFRHGKRQGTQTVADFEKRFHLEDIGILRPDDKSFKWEKMRKLAEYKL